jgi:hypothetical protein
MATLTLVKVFVNRLDTGEAVSANSEPGRGRGHQLAGEVRTYAGGRQRAIATAGLRGQFKVVLRQVSLTTLAVLESWIGVPVQVRDHRGQRFFGVFFAVDTTEHRTSWDVGLSVQTITLAEGV